MASTILKSAAPSSRINHKTARHNIHWDSPVDTDLAYYTSVTGHHSLVTNEQIYMNSSSKQPVHTTMAIGHHNQYWFTLRTRKAGESLQCASYVENKDTNSNDAGKEMCSVQNANETATIQKLTEDTPTQKTTRHHQVQAQLLTMICTTP